MLASIQRANCCATTGRAFPPSVAAQQHQNAPRYATLLPNRLPTNEVNAQATAATST
jgi:hypothetical protein